MRFLSDVVDFQNTSSWLSSEHIPMSPTLWHFPATCECACAASFVCCVKFTYVAHVTGAVVCPPLNISNAWLNTSYTNYSTAVLVTCNSGYAINPYDIRNNIITTVCSASGNWSTYPISCQRQYCNLRVNFCHSRIAKDVGMVVALNNATFSHIGLQLGIFRKQNTFVASGVIHSILGKSRPIIRQIVLSTVVNGLKACHVIKACAKLVSPA
jgi:hypothetical protein